MTDLAIKKLEAENKTLKAKNNKYAKRICQQQTAIEQAIASENELLGDYLALKATIVNLDKEIDQLRAIIAPKHFLNFVDEKELKATESN
jgi:hypothetical protein